jgi:hypothetical protein
MVAGAIAVGLGWKDNETVQAGIGIVMSVAGAVWQLFDHNNVQQEVKTLRTEVKSLKGLK